MLLPSSGANKRKFQQGRSSSYWSYLPDDLKVDILCRLPDKQLGMLKCISKSWYFLISNHCAPKISATTFWGLTYTRKVPRTCLLSLQFSSYSEYVPSSTKLCWKLPQYMDAFLPFRHKPDDFHDCCNGLLLMAPFSSTSTPTQYYLVNPTTNECILIPINPDHVNEKDTFPASLMFDPRSVASPTSFLIVVPRGNGCITQHSLKLDIFSSCLNRWSSHCVTLEPVLEGFRLIGRSIYLNGILYMLSLAKYLVSIDLKKDEANSELIHSRATELPGNDEFDKCGSFGASRGSLVYCNCDNSRIVVWQLQNGAYWNLQHIISFDDIAGHQEVHPEFQDQRNVGMIRVYAFHPNSDEIFLGTPFWIQRYNPRTKELKRYSGLLFDRIIACGQYKVFPLLRCAVILRSAINEHQ